MTIEVKTIQIAQRMELSNEETIHLLQKVQRNIKNIEKDYRVKTIQEWAYDIKENGIVEENVMPVVK